MNAAQAGFVGRKQSPGGGFVGKRAKGGGENYVGIGGGEFRFNLGFLGDHFAIDEGRFDTGGAANAPAGGEHLGDQILLLQGGGFVDGIVVFEHAVEGAAI